MLFWGSMCFIEWNSCQICKFCWVFRQGMKLQCKCRSKGPLCNFGKPQVRIPRHPEICMTWLCDSRDSHSQVVWSSRDIFLGCVLKMNHSIRRVLLSSGVWRRLGLIALQETLKNDVAVWEINVNKSSLAREGDLRWRHLIWDFGFAHFLRFWFAILGFFSLEHVFNGL